jgi:hypothetical protein
MQTLLPELEDKTTLYYKINKKSHPWYNHLMCVIFRIMIGLIILNIESVTNNMVLVYSTIVILIFLYKFIFAPPSWKVYIRTVLLYIIIVVNYKNKNFKSIATAMIILDAIMGLQSRFVQGNISRAIMMEKNSRQAISPHAPIVQLNTIPIPPSEPLDKKIINILST